MSPAQWAPVVLSDYEVGQAVAAVEAVSRLDKPLAEVGCRRGSIADLEADLRGCLQAAGEPTDVSST